MTKATSLMGGEPEIIALAKALGRTPSALSYKLANFARFDPALKQRNISGATHGGKLEKDVWDEFNEDWERLALRVRHLGSRSPEVRNPTQKKLNFPKGQRAKPQFGLG